MANYVFSKYWIEGTKEGIHELYDAIVNADGEAIHLFGLRWQFAPEDTNATRGDM